LCEGKIRIEGNVAFPFFSLVLTQKKRYVSCLSILFFTTEDTEITEWKRKENAEVAEGRNERKFFKKIFFKKLSAFP
jgi:hypothetical protein